MVMAIRYNIKLINTESYIFDRDYFRIQAIEGSVCCNFYGYSVENYEQILELLSYVQGVVAKRAVEGSVTIGGMKFGFKSVTKHEKKVQGKDISEWSLRCIFNGQETYLDYRQCYIIYICLQKCLQFFTARPTMKKIPPVG